MYIHICVVASLTKVEVCKNERPFSSNYCLMNIFIKIVHETVSYNTRVSAHGCFILSGANT